MIALQSHKLTVAGLRWEGDCIDKINFMYFLFLFIFLFLFLFIHIYHTHQHSDITQGL